MTRPHPLHLAVAATLLAASAATPAFAQSTDGYHSIQVFPVVVDSGAFTQRFTFRNPDADNDLTVTPTYVPGDGTAQATTLTCPNLVVPKGGTLTRASLRDVCPALAAGSQYGFLSVSEASAENRPFAAFSRVSNPNGAGFAVEAFPAHTFTSADSVVAGIRRLGATPTSPAFQTNCFIGNLNEVTPGAVTFPTTVDYTVFDPSGAPLGNASVVLNPGHLTRLLDVFAAAGVAPGDHPDASVLFEELGSGEPGLMTFCTVQDNTSFGADFRIGKQEHGYLADRNSVGAQDDHVNRDLTIDYDLGGTGGAQRAFVIPAGSSTNTHVVYFRHPDYVQCEVVDPSTGLRASPDYGLELRMVDQEGAVVAGGNDATGFGEVYLGDKGDRNEGANTRYLLQVENSGVNDSNDRPYALHCQSGSGHTMGDMVRYQSAGTSF